MMNVYACVDLIDKIPGPPIIVRAALRLLHTEEGGRQSALRSAYAYRPNHNFGGPDDREFYVGQIDLGPDGHIEPGDSREVIVWFVPGPGLLEKLQVGRRWRIQEGGQLVGEATVLEVSEA